MQVFSKKKHGFFAQKIPTYKARIASTLHTKNGLESYGSSNPKHIIPMEVFYKTSGYLPCRIS